MTPQRRRLLLILAAAGLLLLGTALWPVARAAVIRPLALALWSVWRVLLSIDQRIYWQLLIFAAFLLALRALPERGERLERKYRPDEAASRVETWRGLFRPAARTPHAPEALAGELKKLSNAVDAELGLPLSPRATAAHRSALFSLPWLPPALRAQLDPDFRAATDAARATLTELEQRLEINNDQLG